MAAPKNKDITQNIPRINDKQDDPLSPSMDVQRTTVGAALKQVIANHYTQEYDLSGLHQGIILKVEKNPKKFDYSTKNEVEILNNNNNQERYKVRILSKAGVTEPTISSLNDKAISSLNDYIKSPKLEGTLPLGTIVFVNLDHKMIEYTFDKSKGVSVSALEQEINTNASDVFKAPTNIPNLPNSTKPISNAVTTSPKTIKLINPPIKGNYKIKDVNKIKEVINQFGVENNPRYKPDKETWSNVYAWDVSVAMGVKIYPRFYSKKEQTLKNEVTNVDETLLEGQPVNNNSTPKFEFSPSCEGIITTNANTQALWFKRYSTKFGWKILGGPEQAQKYANEGRLVIGAWENTKKLASGQHIEAGHIIIVRPDEHSYNSSRGPRISQAGAKNIADGYFIMGAGTPEMMFKYVYATPIIGED